MNSLRRFSRRAWLLHGYLIVSMVLWPVQPGSSYWTDSGGGEKVMMDDPPVGDSWWDQDSDGDGLTNAEEVVFGSDPYSNDSDHDGLSDLVERDYTPPALPFDPWEWDSDGDGYSDFDEYYEMIQGYSPVVDYLNLPGGPTWDAGTFYSYFDADGDGTPNPDDGDPLNMDRDEDGVLNWDDAWPDDPENGGTPWEDPAMMTDSDGDGIDDSSDPFPYGSYWYEGIEYGGGWSDRDNDGIPDESDPFPDGSYWHDGIEYGGSAADQDGDGIPDDFDPWPSIAGSFWYDGTEYPGTWNDQDDDGIPDAADATPEGSYWWDGYEYFGAWVDQDGDGVPDPFDPFPEVYGSYVYDGQEYAGEFVDSDMDGIPDALDESPSDGYVYDGVFYEGEWIDTDGDGVPDPADSSPEGSFWYDGVEYAGIWHDPDDDGIPDPFDATPYGGYWYGDVEYAGSWTDSDGDTIPDPADPTPNGSYWHEGVEYEGTWADADEDGIPDGADGWPSDRWNGEPHFEYNGSEYAGEWSDRDGDSVPDQADSWPDDPENGTDDDNDGLSNYDERTLHYTDPNDVDSDDDYLTDYEELLFSHTNPLAPRTNLATGQTLLDGQLHLGADSDHDGLPDLVEDFYAELGFGLDKSNPADGGSDLDSDGVSNAQAFQYGWNLVANRSVYDQDGDHIDDAVEDYWAAVYPGSLDKTIFADAVEDFDQDGLMNYEEVIRHQIGDWLVPLDPGDRHSIVTVLGLPVVTGATITDGQFMTWWWDVNRPDFDFDYSSEPPVGIAAHPVYLVLEDEDPVNGLPDGYEMWGGTPPRPVPADLDSDGLPNVWEYRYDFNLRDGNDAGPPSGPATASTPHPGPVPDPNDPSFNIDGSFDQTAYDEAVASHSQQLADHATALDELSRIDPDGDTLSNLREFLLGTHPRMADTDNDGFNDDVEVAYGADPTSLQSVPLPVLQITGGNAQTIVPSQMSAAPLEVRLTLAGVPISGAPVSFDLLDGVGIFQDAEGQPLDSSLPLLTDAEGKVGVFIMAVGQGGTLLIRASSPSAPQPVAFTASVQMPQGGGSNTGGNTGNTTGNTTGTSSAGAGPSAWMQMRHTSGSWTKTEAGPISIEEHEGTLNSAGTAYDWTVNYSSGGEQVEAHAGNVNYDGGGSETTSSEGDTRTKTQNLKEYQAPRKIESITLTSSQYVITGSEPGPSQADLEAEALAKNPVPQTITYSLVNMPPANGWDGESAQIRLVRAPGSDVSQPVSVTFMKITDVKYSPADPNPSDPYHPSQTVESKTLTIIAKAATSTETLVGMAAHAGSRSGNTTVSLLPVDLEVDSNNDGTIDGADTAVEDVESGGSIDKMGHHLQVNTFDYDADKVPDYIDGITKGGTPLASAGGNSIAGDPQRHFSKLKMTLGFSRSEYDFMFEYSADNPNNMSVSQGSNFGQKEQVGGAVENYNISAPGGSLRIWTKDADTSRKAESITASTAGDFVPANEWIAGDKMPTGDMFLEGVRPSTGWGSDKIKLKARSKTSTGTEFVLDSVSLTVSKSVLRVYVNRPYTYEAAATVKRPQLVIDYSTPRSANTSVFNAMHPTRHDPVVSPTARGDFNWYGHGFWCASYAGPGDTSIMTANETGPDGTKEYWSGKTSGPGGSSSDQRTALKEGKVFWFIEPGLQHGRLATVNTYQAATSPTIHTPAGEDMKIIAWHDFIVPPKLLQKICTYPGRHDFTKYGLDIGATEGGCASYVGLTLKDAGMQEHLKWEVRNHLSTTYSVTNEFPVVPIPGWDWFWAWSESAVINLARDNFIATPGTDTWGGYTPAWQLNFYDPGLLATWMDELRRTNKRTSTIYNSLPPP